MESERNVPSLQLQLNSAFASAYGDVAKTALGIVGQDMAVESIRMSDSAPEAPAPEGLEVRGRLLRPSADVFTRWLAEFNAKGFTPFLRHDDSPGLVGGVQNVILQVMTGVAPRTQSNPWINLALFGVTVLSTLFVGALYEVDPNIEFEAAAWLVLTSPSLLLQGWPFAATLLGILTAHEFGHYFAARYHKVAVTLPYFLPMPLGFGTLGAFIRMKEPMPDRRKLFDIGVAGPLAGLIIAVPMLFIGLLTSQVVPSPDIPNLVQEGNNLLYFFAKYWVYGRILPDPVAGLDVFQNQILGAAWIGLLVTALNLLPLGQLDGGHTVFALFGKGARIFNWAALGGMLLLGIAGLAEVQARIPGLENIGWSGWFLWLVMINFLGGPFHPPALDDVTELDTRRRWIGYAVIAIFVLIFIPVPLRPL